MQKVPAVAILLGASGVLPFAWYGMQHSSYRSAAKEPPTGDAVLARAQALTGLPLSYFASHDQHTVRHRFVTYSASVLSFLGAVHWGAAMCGPQGTGLVLAQYTFSVLPSLLAWGALCVPEGWNGNRDGTARHTLLAGGYLASYLVDEACGARKVLPPFYTHLRTPLTFSVVAIHCLTAVLSRAPSVSDMS
jgi:hypothetical protein